MAFFTIPLVLLLFTASTKICFGLRLCSGSANTLPSSPIDVLVTGSFHLDRVVAVSQWTGSISVGFIESPLPDPCDLHIDYTWISAAMQPGMYFTWSFYILELVLMNLAEPSRA
jgi:hypothetical protein